jgi:hypothetical protein
MHPSTIEPMPESLRLRLPLGLVLEVARHHERRRTWAMMLIPGRGVGSRCLWYGRAAEA